MTIVDVFIGAGILIGVMRGLGTGVIRQTAGLVGLLLAFAIGIQFMGPLGDRLAEDLGWHAPTTRLVVFVLIIVAVHILLAIATRVLETVLGVLRLTSVDRALGGVMGGLKAALIVSVVLLVLAFFDRPGERSRDASALYHPVAGLLPEAWDFMAEHLPVIKGVADEFGRDVATRLDIEAHD